MDLSNKNKMKKGWAKAKTRMTKCLKGKKMWVYTDSKQMNSKCSHTRTKGMRMKKDNLRKNKSKQPLKEKEKPISNSNKMKMKEKV